LADKKDKVRKSLENNKHTDLTTTYYLNLKKKICEGLKSNADISALGFKA
jgi:hypothetical protein